MHAAAAVYPHSTLHGTPTCSNLSSTASYKTYIAGQEEFGCGSCPQSIILDSVGEFWSSGFKNFYQEENHVFVMM